MFFWKRLYGYNFGKEEFNTGAVSAQLYFELQRVGNSLHSNGA